MLEGCDTVEATPLESLPGHKAFTKQNDLESQTTNDKYLNKTDPMMPAPKISQFDVPSSSTINTQPGKLSYYWSIYLFKLTSVTDYVRFNFLY